MNAEWFAPRPMTSKALQMPRAENLGAKQNGARSGGRTGRLLVRSAWGNPGPQGRRGRVSEDMTSSPLLESEDGSDPAHPYMRITHTFAAKTHKPRRN